MVSTHTWWFNQRSDLIFVPTEIARQRGLSYGLKPDQIRVVGLPVAQRFCQPLESGQSFRDKMGWPQELPVILLIGGGDGMGSHAKTARAISDAHLIQNQFQLRLGSQVRHPLLSQNIRHLVGVRPTTFGAVSFCHASDPTLPVGYGCHFGKKNAQSPLRASSLLR